MLADSPAQANRYHESLRLGCSGIITVVLPSITMIMFGGRNRCSQQSAIADALPDPLARSRRQRMGTARIFRSGNSQAVSFPKQPFPGPCGRSRSPDRGCATPAGPVVAIQTASQSWANSDKSRHLQSVMRWFSNYSHIVKAGEWQAQCVPRDGAFGSAFCGACACWQRHA